MARTSQLFYGDWKDWSRWPVAIEINFSKILNSNNLSRPAKKGKEMEQRVLLLLSLSYLSLLSLEMHICIQGVGEETPPPSAQSP